jgi:hypothetical protein
MFLESMSDKLPLPSTIVAAESLFVPSGVAKKCVDARSGNTLKLLLVRESQMSLADLSISRPIRSVYATGQAGLREVITKNPANAYQGGTPSGQEHFGLF